MRARTLVIPMIAAAAFWPSPAAVAQEAAVAEVPGEFRIPPGFRKQQRGKHVLYCRKEQVMGTRFPQVKCYDEKGLREMETTLREHREKVDQMRRICGSLAACGGG